MRTVGISIALLLAACSFRTVPGAGPGEDAAVLDGTGSGGDGPQIDGPPIDAPPIDSPPSTARKKRITIDRARVSGAQTQFPVWIVLDDADLMARAAQDGADIHFTDAAGAALPHQIQRWVKTTGRLEAWVRADLSDATDTVLELRYGDPARVTPQNPQAVFANAFAAVWHLDDPLNTSAVADATGQKPGTAAGNLGPSRQVAAQLGGGIDFDGNNDRITFGNPYTGGGSHTFSAWVNQRASTSCDTIVTVGTAQPNQSRWFHSHHELGGRGVSAGFYGNDWPGSATNIDGAGWVLLHWVFNGANRDGRIYRNGAMVGSFSFSNGVDTQGTEGYLGYAPGGWGGCDLSGVLDEIRLATAPRSGGWIATEHANQSSPQTFYMVGTEEVVP